jgi:hypothetical protein
MACSNGVRVIVSDILDGLNKMSIAKAENAVENRRGWGDAIAHAKARIKDLRDSLKVFEQNLERDEFWPARAVTRLRKRASTQN